MQRCVSVDHLKALVKLRLSICICLFVFVFLYLYLFFVFIYLYLYLYQSVDHLKELVDLRLSLKLGVKLESKSSTSYVQLYPISYVQLFQYLTSITMNTESEREGYNLS